MVFNLAVGSLGLEYGIEGDNSSNIILFFLSLGAMWAAFACGVAVTTGFFMEVIRKKKLPFWSIPFFAGL